MENKSYDGGEEKGKIHNSFNSSDENGHKEEEVSIRMREPTSRMSLNVQQINSSKDELITEQKGNFASRAVVRVRIALLNSLVRHRQKVHLLLTAIACLSVLCYFGAVFWHWDRQGRKPLKWCTGDGFLLVMFIIFCSAITYYKAIKPIFSRRSTSKNESSSSTYSRCIGIFKQLIFYCLVIVLLFYLIYDAFGETHRLISIGGMLAFIFIGFFSSKHPNEIKWRTVLIGIFVQITMGMLTIRWDFGRSVFLCIGNRTETFLRFGYEGAAFAFGNYIVHELHVFAFMSLSVIYFMGMIIEILFYVGWIQRMCFNMGWVIQKILGTTIIESVNSVTTVCLGLSEAPLLYRPYIKDLTKSELHAVMAGGFSTVAGTVFAAYTALGVNPSYLITASIMAAPAGLCFAKLLYPETEVSKTTPKNFVFYKSEERSIIDAACKGALSGINIIAGVIATIIASVSLVAFFSSALQWFAALAGVEGFTFQVLVGKILLPIPYIMGVNPEQCEHVAKLIGIKLSLNEFIAYEELGKMKKIGLLTPRSEAMATFALCSFANPGSLACFIAVLVSLCPNQKENVGRVAFRALISGATTSLLTACVAGMLMPETGFGDIGCTNCSRTSYTVV